MVTRKAQPLNIPARTPAPKSTAVVEYGKGECCQKVRIFIDTCYWKNDPAGAAQKDGPASRGPDDGQPDGPGSRGPDDGQPDMAGTREGRTTFLKVGDVGITVRVFD
jgi:hypothetical protein